MTDVADGVDAATLEDRARRVDAALASVDALDPVAALAAHEVKDAIEAFHRDALVTIVRTLKDDQRGKELLFDLVDDPTVQAVLTLHGIIRADPLTRASRVLESVRPYLQSHGGDVELVEVSADGIAHVALHGSCSGCSMSSITLKQTVQEALVDGVPEIVGIEEVVTPTTSYVAVGATRAANPADLGPGWIEGPAVANLAGVTRFDYENPDGTADSVVVVPAQHTDDDAAASFSVFRNECVHQGRSLDAGTLGVGPTGSQTLTCPWHGFSFDTKFGECLNAPGAQLQAIPASVRGGQLWMRPHGG